MSYFHAYIDEAGDEGFVTPELPRRGSTEWFLLAGILVREEDDLDASHVVDRLREKLDRPERKPLHFQKIRRHQARKEMMRTLAAQPFVVVAVAMWKPGITSEFLRKPPNLYNYAARFLIERMSWFADQEGRRLKLYFENRSATSYEELRQYMDWIQADPECSIRHGCVAEYSPLDKTYKLVQVADMYASAIWQAFEPDEFGYAEASYLREIKHQLYRPGFGRGVGGKILGHGLKIFPEPEGAERLSQVNAQELPIQNQAPSRRIPLIRAATSQ